MSKQKERIIGFTTVSPQYQITLITKIRPWFDLEPKPGDHIQFVFRDGEIILRLVKKEATNY